MKKQNLKIENAWEIAFNSAGFNIENCNLIVDIPEAEIRHRIFYIDKSEWLPFALKILEKRPSTNIHFIAEEAATMFINKFYNVAFLKVKFDGNT